MIGAVFPFLSLRLNLSDNVIIIQIIIIEILIVRNIMILTFAKFFVIKKKIHPFYFSQRFYNRIEVD